jgi:hypothetical protein
MHQRCLHLIKECGGRVLAEHDVHESFSGDGLIVGYFGEEPLEWTAPKLTYNRYSQSYFRNPLFDWAIAKKKLESSAIERWRFRWKRALAETRQMRSRFRRRGGG